MFVYVQLDFLASKLRELSTFQDKFKIINMVMCIIIDVQNINEKQIDWEIGKFFLLLF